MLLKSGILVARGQNILIYLSVAKLKFIYLYLKSIINYAMVSLFHGHNGATSTILPNKYNNLISDGNLF